MRNAFAFSNNTRKPINWWVGCTLHPQFTLINVACSYVFFCSPLGILKSLRILITVAFCQIKQIGGLSCSCSDHSWVLTVYVSCKLLQSSAVKLESFGKSLMVSFDLFFLVCSLLTFFICLGHLGNLKGRPFIAQFRVLLVWVPVCGTVGHLKSRSIARQWIPICSPLTHNACLFLSYFTGPFSFSLARLTQIHWQLML